MTAPFARPCRAPSLLAATLAVALAGCATPQREAERLAQGGDPESALTLLVQAGADKSPEVGLRAAYLKQRDAVIEAWIASADTARRAGRLDNVRAILAKVDAVAPRDPRGAWLREQIVREERHRRLLAEAQAAFDQGQWERAEAAARNVLEEDPGETVARRLLTHVSERQAARTRDDVILAAGKKPVSLELHDASLRSVFDALATAGGVNFVFDKDVRTDGKVTLVLRNTTVDDAMRVILVTQQLDRQLLNSNSVLIYQNNAQKQREHQEVVTRSFYLVNADAKRMQDLIRTMVKTKDLHVDDRLNMLVVRDTPDAMRMVERLVAASDLPEAEVTMDVEVMEISSDLLRQLGLSWPTAINYGIVPSADDPTGAAYIAGDLGSLRAYVGNPLVTAKLNGTSGSANLLANPRIRARNHEKAHVQLGNKLPVFTTTTTGAGSITGFIASSVSYLDVGLKLDIEPSVLLDSDIVLKVALEVSSVANQVTGPDGSIAYNVGTRQTSTSIRLKDGETEVLAGLIQDDDRKTAAGVPGLSELPFLGSLFGVRGHSRDKTEVVMLITPHIVRNVSLPPDASAAIESGTDAAPGVPSLRLADGATEISVGPASDAGAAPPTAAPAEPPSPIEAAPPALAPSLGGPQDAVAGSVVQVSVANPGTSVLQAQLSFDDSVLQPMVQTSAPGRLALQVPANGSQSVAFTVKPQLSEGSTTISLGSGSLLTIRLHASAAAVPVAPTRP